MRHQLYERLLWWKGKGGGRRKKEGEEERRGPRVMVVVGGYVYGLVYEFVFVDVKNELQHHRL